MNQALAAVAKVVSFAAALAAFLWVRKQPTTAEQRRRTLNYIREPNSYPPLSSDPLIVETERFRDTDQQAEDGPYSYHYSGMHFVFAHGGRVAKGRYYDDDPNGFNIYLWPPEEQYPKARYAAPPYRDPFFAEVVEYVRRHEPERQRLTMLCEEGYVPVEQNRIAGGARQPGASD